MKKNKIFYKFIIFIFLVVVFSTGCSSFVNCNEAPVMKTTHYPSGNIKELTTYRCGKLDGISSLHDDTALGEGKEMRRYSNGKLESLTIFDKREVVRISDFKNNKITFYRPNGYEGIIEYGCSKFSSEYHGSCDEYHGVAKYYYPNGVIKYLDTYYYGKKTKRKAYDEEGKLKFEQQY